MSDQDRFDRQLPNFLEIKSQCSDFQQQSEEYMRKIQEQVQENISRRQIIHIPDIREKNKILADGILQKPIDYIAPFQDALIDIVVSLPTSTITNVDYIVNDWHIGFTGLYGKYNITPRQISSYHITKQVEIEGIVTRCSTVRPKLVMSVHSRNTVSDIKKNIHLYYHDQTSITSNPTNITYPLRDNEGIPLTTEYGYCIYKDNQSISQQEMPEKSPAGLLPCSIDVILENDLCDKCKPGDRVSIVGVMKPIVTKAVTNDANNNTFRIVLIATSLRPLSIQYSLHSIYDINTQDIRIMKSLVRKEDMFKQLTNSIAPSIYGHNLIKQAIVLLLLGGCEHNLQNGTHIRGDINILLVGDPSTAKSQLLRYVLNLSPLAITTTGRGSSGVGLTAAVVHDKDSGERRQEAGAMVLADRGTICIDEFDKMSDIDRVAIHEVMEQQTVTISKAGIHMSLNARCSVFAAANPIYGCYDTNIKPHANIGLQDSLLSRFDLLFIILDIPDVDIDSNVATTVIINHATRVNNDITTNDNNTAINNDTTSINTKSYPIIYPSPESIQQDPYLQDTFLKKFIYYAREMINPILSQQASDFIVQKYTELRQNIGKYSSYNTMIYPITARTLETLIRLSTAVAKAYLCQEVSLDHSKQAYELFLHSIRWNQQSMSDKVNIQQNYKTDSIVDITQEDAPLLQEYLRNDNISKKRKHNEITLDNIDNDIPEKKTIDHISLLASFIPSFLRKQGGEIQITNSTILKSYNATIDKGSQLTLSELDSFLNELYQKDLIMYRDGIVYILN